MEEMSHLGIIQKAKVIGKIGEVSSLEIGNDGLNAKGYFAIFKFSISVIDNQDFLMHLQMRIFTQMSLIICHQMNYFVLPQSMNIVGYDIEGFDMLI